MQSGLLIGRRAMVVGSMAGLAGCQVPAGGAGVDLTTPHQVGFMVFRAVITPQTRDFFTKAVDAFMGIKVTEVRVGLSSPGGSIEAAENMVDYMNKVHAEHGVVFTMFDVGVVASAACYVFLAGQKRYCSQRGAFLFHAAGVTANGRITAPAMRELVAQSDKFERLVLDALKAKTHLSEGEALSFVRRTVVLNADDARRDGITDGTLEFVVPTAVTPTDIRAVGDTSPLPVVRPRV